MDDSDLEWYLFDHAEIQGICNVFTLGKVIKIHGKLKSFMNVNLKIETDKGMFVLRFLNPSSLPEKDLLSIHHILSVLHEAKVPVMVPLPTRNWKPFFNYRDKFIQAFPFSKGRPFKAQTNQVYHSAVILRKFHEATKNCRFDRSSNNLFYRGESHFRERLVRIKEACNVSDPYLAEFEELIDSVFGKWNKVKDKLPQTILHNDYHFGNQLFKDNGEIACVFDFDYLQRGYRVHDIAFSLWKIYKLPHKKASKTFDKVFLQGYGALTQHEKKALPLAIATVCLFFMSPRKKNFSNATAIIKSKLTKQRAILKWILSKKYEEHLDNIFKSID